MSSFLAPVLRRLFQPKPAAEVPPLDTETIDMPHDASDELVDDPIGALSAAVDLHASVNELERSNYETRIRGAIEDALQTLDMRRNG